MIKKSKPMRISISYPHINNVKMSAIKNFCSIAISLQWEINDQMQCF